MTAVLPQGAGYAIVVGLGLVFSLGMILTTFCLRRYKKEIVTAEEFASAGRSVNSGLACSAICSSWTWAATLLVSTAQCYKHGVSGPYYYASGACVQIILFGFLAIKIKQRAPECHTYLEIVKVRYGKATHAVYIFFALATNVLVTAMLLTGGSASIADLTGMNTVACIFLLPLGVVLYTLFGGLKATFLTDYVHTVALVVIILTFAFTTFATNKNLGSPGKVYDLIVAAGKKHPLSGNAGGSYLTMKSQSAGIFFVINVVGNFGTVFLDTGYQIKGCACDVKAALPAYVLGGLSWFAIPWLTATTMGLAALALESNPVFPTYPNRLTSDEVSAGIVLPSAAEAIMGKGGAVASLFLVFMAVTSAMSGELVAVSNIISFDIYRGYINPKATGKNIIWVSHLTVVAFALIMCGFSTGLYYAGVSMGYLYELMGVLISAAVVPSTLTLLWKDQNRISALVAPIVGTLVAILAWLVSTHTLCGAINLTNTFMDDPMLIGNVVALLAPIVIILPLTYIFGKQNYDWVHLRREIKVVSEKEELEAAIKKDLPDPDSEKLDNEKMEQIVSTLSRSKSAVLKAQDDQEYLANSAKKAAIVCVTLAICLLVLWPMPMYGTGYIFSKKFFTGWIVVAILWMFFTAFNVAILPIIQGRHEIYLTFRGIYWDLTGQSSKLIAWQESNPEELHAVQSQVSIEANREVLADDDDNVKALNEVVK